MAANFTIHIDFCDIKTSIFRSFQILPVRITGPTTLEARPPTVEPTTNVHSRPSFSWFVQIVFVFCCFDESAVPPVQLLLWLQKPGNTTNIQKTRSVKASETHSVHPTPVSGPLCNAVNGKQQLVQLNFRNIAFFHPKMMLFAVQIESELPPELYGGPGTLQHAMVGFMIKLCSPPKVHFLKTVFSTKLVPIRPTNF